MVLPRTRVGTAIRAVAVDPVAMDLGGWRLVAVDSGVDSGVGSWVIVGSLPTKGGNVSGSGCLIVLDSHGTVRETFKVHGINGPWDMTALDLGGIAELFVTNVLNGTVAAGGNPVDRGTVLRLVLRQGLGLVQLPLLALHERQVDAGPKCNAYSPSFTSGRTARSVRTVGTGD